MDLVSIIVPIYNAEAYLDECIMSLLYQTYTNIEIILVDDGSTDNSGLICDRYAQKHTNIKIYHKINGGTSDAKNIGLKYSHGTWLVFVDADDYVENNYVKQLIDGNDFGKIDFVVSGYSVDYLDDRFNINVKFDSEILYDCWDLLKEAIYKIDSCELLNVDVGKLYRAEVIHKHDIKFNNILTTGEDLVFNCHYLRYVKSIKIIDKVLYHYIRRDNISLVNKYRKNLIEMVNICNDARLEIYKFYGMSDIKFQYLYGVKYIDYMASCVPNIYRKNNRLSIRQRRNQIKKIINDSRLQQYIHVYNKNTNIYNTLFIKLCLINNVSIFDFTYYILFIFRNNFDNFYRKIRKQIFIKTFESGEKSND